MRSTPLGETDRNTILAILNSSVFDHGNELSDSNNENKMRVKNTYIRFRASAIDELKTTTKMTGS